MILVFRALEYCLTFLVEKLRPKNQVVRVARSRWCLGGVFGVWLVSGFAGKKTPKCTWLCVGISPVRYALQTR